jgi:hypothetical protein
MHSLEAAALLQVGPPPVRVGRVFFLQLWQCLSVSALPICLPVQAPTCCLCVKLAAGASAYQQCPSPATAGPTCCLHVHLPACSCANACLCQASNAHRLPVQDSACCLHVVLPAGPAWGCRQQLAVERVRDSLQSGCPCNHPSRVQMHPRAVVSVAPTIRVALTFLAGFAMRLCCLCQLLTDVAVSRCAVASVSPPVWSGPTEHADCCGVPHCVCTLEVLSLPQGDPAPVRVAVYPAAVAVLVCVSISHRLPMQAPTCYLHVKLPADRFTCQRSPLK